MSEREHIFFEEEVPEGLDGKRFDQAVASLFSDYSRSKLQSWIKQGGIVLDGKPAKSKDKVYVGQIICLDVEIEPVVAENIAQPIDLDVVYEDDSILVVNKPAGLVVHPAAGNASNTLLNGLLHRNPKLETIPRAGIVHRLDKDTTGLMVVAKTLPAHADLVAQLQERTVSRHYYALVQGRMTAGSTVETLMGRHPTNRKKQAVLETGGRDAITHYRVVERFREHSLIRCELETGRTHQIRVHMAHCRYPLIGDKLYGGRTKLPKGASKALINALQQFPRQALHAFRLGLIHPETGDYCEWEIDLPDDMTSLMDKLRDDAEHD